MATIPDTAYPRFGSSIAGRSLDDSLGPTIDEIVISRKRSTDRFGQFSFLAMLKSFQLLGYFPRISEVPVSLSQKIAKEIGISVPTKRELEHHDRSSARQRQRLAVLKHLHVKSYSGHAATLVRHAMQAEIDRKDDLVDLINVAIEELIRNAYELPGFSTLLRTAQEVRTNWSEDLFTQIEKKLTLGQQQWLDRHLEFDFVENVSFWQTVKTDPGNPTLTELRSLIDRYKKLNSIEVPANVVTTLSRAKIERFSMEAKTRYITTMRRIRPGKRYTLALCLYYTSRSRVLDDLTEMLIKRVKKTHHKAHAELEEFRRQHQKRIDQLIMKLGEVAKAVSSYGGAKRKLRKVQSALGKAPEKIIEDCEMFTAYADNNAHSFEWKYLKSHRGSLIELLRLVELRSTSEDQTLVRAIEFLLNHADDSEDWLEITTKENGKMKIAIDMSIIPTKWWKCVTGLKSKNEIAVKVDRKHFEACVFSLLSDELQSGDVAVVGADRFSDYRSTLISDKEFLSQIGPYAQSVGLPVDRSSQFVAELKENLLSKIIAVDRSLPENTSIKFENGTPILSKAPRKSDKKRLSAIEEMVRSRLEPITIIDVLSDTENWLRWSQFFKPASGQDARIKQANERYIATVFCYGCGLGPTQTARSLKDPINKSQISWVDHHHVSEAALDKAITNVVNAYRRFELPKIWGTGEHVSADGTKWEVGSKNLLSEYHIRYGGYGGIGYYHVSDTYVALFSRFIPCGVWEAVYILDGLLANQSEIKPEIIHGDTQAQNTPVFALSHLLGVKLMPRIRNWKDLKLFRPTKTIRLENLNTLIADDVIDWRLIQQHMPDMMRIVLSIHAGKIAPSTILRKLGSISKKNKLYFSFRELGRVIRTLFLLDFITDSQLRAMIQSSTNKSEAFNGFVDWLDFGGAGLRYENDRDEQRRLIKYNHLTANLVILYNVQALTKILNEFAEEGTPLDERTVSQMSPYLTAHINRFGDYRIDRNRKPKPLSHEIKIQQRVL